MVAQELVSGQKIFALAVGGQEMPPPGPPMPPMPQDPYMPPARFDGVGYAKTLPGITAPTGFFDPLGFCSKDDITEGKIKFYREVELKHGRVSMLAALGFLVGEQFHPLFGGNIDVPSYIAFQQTPLETFWYIVSVAVAIPEVLFAIPT